MRARLPIVLVSLALTVPPPAPLLARPAAPPGERGLQLYKQLQRDPLLVLGVWLDDPTGELKGLEGLLDRLSGLGPGLTGPETLTRLQGEVLPHLGPEAALVLDFPPIDEAVLALQRSKADAVAAFLARTGLVAGVQDREGLETVLRAWILSAGGELTDAEGLTEAAIPLAEDGGGATTAAPSELRLFWGFERNRWALGFSPEWVRQTLGARPKGARLADGEDFKRVFATLDPEPSDLLYLNLPKLRELAMGSQVVRMVVQADPSLQDIAERFFTSDTMGVGLGATSIRVPGGVRTANFGPPWMSGAAISSGYVVALAAPRFLGAGDRGRARQTGTDIRAIAQACEGFSTDSRSYPGPTDGWVPVERIATFLEPVYIGRLPRTDGWQNPILYWSDGASYRVVSTGRDGQMDRDWTGQADGHAADGVDGDIVFGDGEKLAWPTWLTGD
jgi:hypothetical protein